MVSALDTPVASAQTTFAVVLAMLAIFGPPALVAALIAFAVIRLRRRMSRGETIAGAPID